MQDCFDFQSMRSISVNTVVFSLDFFLLFNRKYKVNVTCNSENVERNFIKENSAGGQLGHTAQSSKCYTAVFPPVLLLAFLASIFLKAWGPVCVLVCPMALSPNTAKLTAWTHLVNEGSLPAVYSSNNAKAEKLASVCQSSWHFDICHLSQSISTRCRSPWFKPCA